MMPQSSAPVRMLTDYQQMVLIRAFEDKVLELHDAGKITGVVHPYVGQEAIAVGLASEMTGVDHLVSTYRCHGFALALGSDPNRLMAELMGRESGLCRGRAGSILVVDRGVGLLASIGIVASGVPIAAGAALSAQVQQTGGVGIAVIGDGAMGAGIVYETLNVAAAQDLPLIVICENNSYQDHTRTDQVLRADRMATLAAGHLMSATTVDGNDVDAVREAVKHAVGHARAGGGPSFIEALTYLSYFHLQFKGRPPEYRPRAEREHWASRDPVEWIALRLRQAGANEETLGEIRAAARERVAEATEFALSGNPPAPHEAHELIFEIRGAVQ